VGGGGKGGGGGGGGPAPPPPPPPRPPPPAPPPPPPPRPPPPPPPACKRPAPTRAQAEERVSREAAAGSRGDSVGGVALKEKHVRVEAELQVRVSVIVCYRECIGV
jgi:hypothetical protein